MLLRCILDPVKETGGFGTTKNSTANRRILRIEEATVGRPCCKDGQSKSAKKSLSWKWKAKDPKLSKERWEVPVTRDASDMLGVRGWKPFAANRESWRLKMKEDGA